MSTIVYVSPDNKTALVTVPTVFDRTRPGDSTGHFFQVLTLDDLVEIPVSRKLSLDDQERYCQANQDFVDKPYIPVPRNVLCFQHGSPNDHGFNGLTNELAIAATLHRLERQQAMQGSSHNQEAIDHLKAALKALEDRHHEVHGK